VNDERFAVSASQSSEKGIDQRHVPAFPALPAWAFLRIIRTSACS
jgi:hypothetical protein